MRLAEMYPHGQKHTRVGTRASTIFTTNFQSVQTYTFYIRNNTQNLISPYPDNAYPCRFIFGFSKQSINSYAAKC